MIQEIFEVIWYIAMAFLLMVQYTMVISDWRSNNSANWEKAVGIIPFGPYILMLLTGVWHLLKRLILG
jgi:hypothetical protein